MNAELSQFVLAETFSGFHYITNGKLKDTGSTIEIKIRLLPIKSIAIFMLCVALAVPFGLSLFGLDAKTVIGFSFAAVLCGGMFVGMLALVNQSSTKAKLPFIDKASEELVLSSGTRIGKGEIAHFRQFQCKTKLSNFQLVATTVVTRDQKQYAVCAETGKFQTTKIGSGVARYLGAENKHSSVFLKNTELLQKLGLE